MSLTIKAGEEEAINFELDRARRLEDEQADGLEEGEVDGSEEAHRPRDSRPVCPLACVLLLRYGLPCKH
jgi:hypothetical protein